MNDIPKNDNYAFVCASLSDQVERQNSFRSNFLNSNYYKILDSIDGRKWTEETADSYVSFDLQQVRADQRLRGKHWINPAAIACAITHTDVLLQQAERKKVIICEDDVIIRDDFIRAWSLTDVKGRLAELSGVVLVHYLSRTPIIVTTPPPSLNLATISYTNLTKEA